MIHYEGRIFRPPSEAHSLIIQSTIGCSHNGCTFCDMYKEKAFRIRPVIDVLFDIDEARRLYPRIDRVFLADGDALMRKSAETVSILEHIKTIMPECERVTSYASPKSVLTKTPDELRALAEAGLSMAYLGLESGSDKVLAHVNKGATAKEIIAAGLMLKAAGIKLSVTAISGLGGKADMREHALETARALSEIKPDYIGLLTLMFEGDTPLEREWREGRFELLDAREVAEETKLLLEHIDSEGSVFRSNHASNYLALAGTLNGDKEKLIAKLERALGGSERFRPEYFRGL